MLLGGTSSEHDVSVNSGLNVLDALLGRGHPAESVYIDPSGGWHFDFRPPPPSLERSGTDDAPGNVSLAPDRDASVGIFERLRDTGFDAIFVALHGPAGEDGRLQGLLRLAGVPFTGSDVLASALAMDKQLSKSLLTGVGIATPAADALAAGATDEAVRAAAERLGFPCVVKPVRGGSSFGTQVVRTPDGLLEAFGEARALDERVLLEGYVSGTEVTCGVLGGGHEPSRPLPLTEIVPVDDEFFDFRAKYTVGACDEITPARLEPAVAVEVQRLAVLAHDTLGCEGMSRSDFIVGDDGPLYLETNTIPGMTRTSLLPQGAAAAGIPFDDLVERLVRSAIERAALR